VQALELVHKIILYTQAANAQIYVGRDALADSVFPDAVVKSDGFVLRRPAEWR
jgi:hypothetical protein